MKRRIRAALKNLSESMRRFAPDSGQKPEPLNIRPFDDMALPVLFRRICRPDGGWRPLPTELSAFDQVKKAVFEAAGNTPETRKALLDCGGMGQNIIRQSVSSIRYQRIEGHNELVMGFRLRGYFPPLYALPFSPLPDMMRSLPAGPGCLFRPAC